MNKYLIFAVFFASRCDATGLTNAIRCDANAAMNTGCHLLDYSLTWITTACEPPYVLSMDGECITGCPSGQYMFGNTCVSCGQNCDLCFGEAAFQCSTCSTNYALDFQNICAFQCDGSRQLYGIAATPTNPNDQCYSCHESCGSCFRGYGTACTSCPVLSTGKETNLRIFDYAVGRTNAGVCLRKTSVDYSNYFRMYPGDRMVTQCPIGCASCVDSFLCTSCDDGYTLFPTSGAGYALCYASTTS